ncbi:MAG TPA: CocE/NonD family hydrolase [Candidatus Limnocylindrales bacterium]|nr:CocE/NonD family hydrolase [Candidatus Limnocylindrales bacterium]
MPRKLSEVRQALRSVWPILRRSIATGQLWNPQCRLTPPHPDVLCEYDVRIPLADGFHVTANVFRSRRAAEAGERMPVVMCAHPYDNHLVPALGKTPLGGPPLQYRLIPQVGLPEFSTLTSWESPDPNFWIPSGYAVVNMNLPGFANSEGPPIVFGTYQAKCFYEAIEWIAAQPWCTGRVGLSGVSFLAITQYHVAACQAYGGPPPSLRCIAPWEGVTDLYRDQLCPGGIEDEGFAPFWWVTEVEKTINCSPEEFERHNGFLPMDFLRAHPFYDEFWEQMTPKLEQITLPMLVCASFSDHGLHTVGSFRAFERASSRHKWVYTHRTGKWAAYYSPEVQRLTRDFMDCFLRDDTSSGFLDRAPVRLEVRSSRDVVHAVRDEQEWPLARTRYTPLHLWASPRELAVQPAAEAGSVDYPARGGRAAFTFRFERDTELTGYMKLRLWVEARSDAAGAAASDDMAIFVAVAKRDRSGRMVHFHGSVGNRYDLVSRGFCRVSRRELDAARSTPWQPVISGRSHWPLQPGEIVPVDIEIYPSSTFFAAGESLELIVAADEIIPSPPYRKNTSMNRGRHVLHMGGQFDAHLLVPIVA